jgi:hypothetical protein
MREFRSYGSVRGACSNARPYRDPHLFAADADATKLSRMPPFDPSAYSWQSLRMVKEVGMRVRNRTAENAVLLASRRRCCLCVFLDDFEGRRVGQIAHLNRSRDDSRFENLVYLCLEHHAEFDSRSGQSKGLSIEEVREYRNRLYARNSEFRHEAQTVDDASQIKLGGASENSPYDLVRQRFRDELEYISGSWRFPLWQVANEPELFAYKAGNRADGVCLIERIDLPDGKIVVACIQPPGNPGNSITNCVEELCFQVCERFEIPPDRLVWLEHYEADRTGEWKLVTFKRLPPQRPFEDPSWIDMTPEMWSKLRLQPRKKLRHTGFSYESKLRKLFSWPTENLA